MRLLPLTPEIAALSETLSINGDPADRIIVATALVHQCALLTKDGNIKDSGVVKTIW